MDNINLTSKQNFPFGIKAASVFQDTMQMLSKMVALGGDNYVLTGCTEDSSGNVADGTVVINGEIMPFKGGVKKAKIKIVENRESTEAFGVQYPDAYVFRFAEFSDTGDFDWGNFNQIISNQELWSKIESIKGDPPGIRVSWCGTLDKIPSNYMLCDGSTLSKDDYPELFENIGFTFGAVGTSQFKLPDLRERFSVCYSGQGDYNSVGDSGGLAAVSLSEDEMAEHDHTNDNFFNKLSARASDVDSTNTPGSVDSQSPSNEYRVSGMSGMQWVNATISKVGKGKPHENRPPFFVEAFIIKVKY